MFFSVGPDWPVYVTVTMTLYKRALTLSIMDAPNMQFGANGISDYPKN